MFVVQRFQCPSSGETTYLELTEQLCAGAMSARLAEFSAYYSSRLRQEPFEQTPFAADVSHRFRAPPVCSARQGRDSGLENVRASRNSLQRAGEVYRL